MTTVGSERSAFGGTDDSKVGKLPPNSYAARVNASLDANDPNTSDGSGVVPQDEVKLVRVGLKRKLIMHHQW
jgi:hypothetical protein